MRWFAYSAVVSVGIAIAAVLIAEVVFDGKPFWQASIFIGSLLLTIGWIITNETRIITLRKQHTFDLISDFISNQIRIQNRKTIKILLPNKNSKVPADLYDKDSDPNMIAIDSELDYFEFIAVGINIGDLNEAMLKRSMHGTICRYYTKCSDYIAYTQQSYDENTWKNLAELCDRWSKDKSGV